MLGQITILAPFLNSLLTCLQLELTQIFESSRVEGELEASAREEGLVL